MATASGGVGTVRLGLLDGFRLQVGDGLVKALASAERLLAYLALRGPVPRVVAAGTLWSDVPDDHAQGSLRTAMWRCNRAVRGVVRSERAQLALASFVQVDVAELISGAAVMLDGAGAGGNQPLLTLRSMELLPGWYDDWVIFERERLRQLRLHALEAAAGRLAETGQYAAALELALEAVRCDPLRETAQRAVIQVHVAEHNMVEAMRTYLRFRRLLVEELGIEPSAELADLVFTRAPARRIVPAPSQPGVGPAGSPGDRGRPTDRVAVVPATRSDRMDTGRVGAATHPASTGPPVPGVAGP